MDIKTLLSYIFLPLIVVYGILVPVPQPIMSATGRNVHTSAKRCTFSEKSRRNEIFCQNHYQVYHYFRGIYALCLFWEKIGWEIHPKSGCVIMI